METEVTQIVSNSWGLAIALSGGAFAVIMGGIGSTLGVSMTGQAGAGLAAEKPNLFGKILVLEALPATQGIYGFLVGFLVLMATGVLSGTPDLMSISEGVKVFAACLPAGLSCYASAIYQGKVSTAGMGMIAKDETTVGKAMVLSAMVETYAVLGFLISALIIFSFIK